MYLVVVGGGYESVLRGTYTYIAGSAGCMPACRFTVQV